MDFVEDNYTECEDECCEAGGVAEGGPAEFAHAEHAELEGFHDAGQRICLHQHFEARVFDGAERVNHRSGVHPKLHNECEQECQVAVFGGEAAEQHAKAECECRDERDKYRREQQVDIRMYRRVGKNQVVREYNQKKPHLDAESHQVACDGRKWHNKSRKVHLAEHVCVFNKSFTGLVQAFRKVGPQANAREVKERLRKSVSTDFGDTTEHDHEHDGSHDGLDKEPQWSKNRLLVPSNDITFHEHAVQIAVLPYFAQVYRE